MKKIAVFASGSGSNFEAIMTACQDGTIRGGEVVLLVCDKPGAYVNERAEKYGIPSFVFAAKQYEGKEAYERDILNVLREKQVDFIVLAGYMRLVGKVLLDAYGGKIINLHPSLLPAFPGKDAIGQAYDYGVKVTGVTVHLVDEGLDTGPIIAQRSIPVEEGESRESIEQKIHEEEHRLLPQVIQWLIDERIRVNGRKVEILTD
ncbi:MAG: phosphoribosylglycinamide formyltransferase [Bacillaceae bacterium]|nr:phosphoribosylglycinamide formyltransferase [Bacillaceae bacterium]